MYMPRDSPHYFQYLNTPAITAGVPLLWELYSAFDNLAFDNDVTGIVNPWYTHATSRVDALHESLGAVNNLGHANHTVIVALAGAGTDGHDRRDDTHQP